MMCFNDLNIKTGIGDEFGIIFKQETQWKAILCLVFEQEEKNYDES